MNLKPCILGCIVSFTLACGPVVLGTSVDSFSPVAGSPGDPNFVFIYGTGFANNNLVVTFNTTRDFSASATAADGTVIQASVPAGATVAVDVTVKNISTSAVTLTPPFAINMFVTQSMFGVPTTKIVPGLIPFIIIHTLALIPVTYIPALSLLLTRFI